MGVRILTSSHADPVAVLYSSSTDWAFGPVFYSTPGHDADERAEAFLDWLRIDPRSLEDAALERKYHEWITAEPAYWAEKAAAAAKEWEEAEL
jgi:hypothetical protein